MRIVERYFELLGTWGHAAVLLLVLTLAAASLAVFGEKTGRPASVLTVALTVLTLFTCVAPIAGAREAILERLWTTMPSRASMDGPIRLMYALLGGGVISLGALTSAIVALVRRGPEAARSVALLVMVAALPAAAMALEMGSELRPLSAASVFAVVDTPQPKFVIAALAGTTLAGVALVAMRLMPEASGLSGTARALALALTFGGIVVFIAARPIAADVARPLPESDWGHHLSAQVSGIPEVRACEPLDEMALVTVDADGSVTVYSRLVSPEEMLQDLDTIWRNWTILHGEEPPVPRRIQVQVASDDDPRPLGPYLRALREGDPVVTHFLVRVAGSRPTASLGEIEMSRLCLLPFEIASDGASGDDVIPLARVTDGQALARAIASGGRRVAPQ